MICTSCEPTFCNEKSALCILSLESKSMVFIYVIAAFIGLVVLGKIVGYIRDYLIRKSRKDDKPEDFTDYFVGEGFSESLVLSVYHHLQDCIGPKDFPVRPRDNVAKIYGIVDDDLDDLVVEIAEANQLVLPLVTGYWQKPVVTVEDLVRFIASFPVKDQN